MDDDDILNERICIDRTIAGRLEHPPEAQTMTATTPRGTETAEQWAQRMLHLDLTKTKTKRGTYAFQAEIMRRIDAMEDFQVLVIETDSSGGRISDPFWYPVPTAIEPEPSPKPKLVQHGPQRKGRGGKLRRW